ncbi:hypothetical protein SBADM41S_06581 [Streptomyces badius]
MPLRRSAGSGIGQEASPTSSAISWTDVRKASSLAMMPKVRLPSAITIAPVRVATSTIASGFSSEARVRASARTRPSASVLSTSTVLPLYMRSTSPGRVALPEGMFSASASQPVTLTFRPRRAAVTTAANTAAAPLMSHFIVSLWPAA